MGMVLKNITHHSGALLVQNEGGSCMQKTIVVLIWAWSSQKSPTFWRITGAESRWLLHAENHCHAGMGMVLKNIIHHSGALLMRNEGGSCMRNEMM